MAGSELPLAGIRVAVTRPAHLALELVAALERRGATTLQTPTIQILPPEDPQPLRDAAARLFDYDWVIFSSVNAVDGFFEVRSDWPTEGRNPRIAAVGSSTKQRIVERLSKATPILTGPSSTAKSLFETLRGEGPLNGQRVLVPRADIATGGIADWLADAGASVDSPVAYRTANYPRGARELSEAISRREVDVVVFTSGSTARAYAEVMQPEERPSFRCVSIGPQTSANLRDVGIQPDVEADEHHVAGLVDAVIDCMQD